MAETSMSLTQDMVSDRLAQAITLIKKGEKEKGANILANLLTIEPNIELGWLWLYVCVETKERKIDCLEMALEINPNRGGTREALDKLINSRVKFADRSGQAVKSVEEADFKNEPTSVMSDAKEQPTEETKDEVQASPVKPSVRKRNSKTESEVVDLAKENIQQALDYGNKTGNGKEKADTTKIINIPYKPPTIIIVRSEDNLFSDRSWQYNKIPRLDSGMYGSTFFIDDIRINAFHLPGCLRIGHILDDAKCDLCDFFSMHECAIRDDPYLIDDMMIFFVNRRQGSAENRMRKRSKIRAIYSELKAHGRPLHFSVLAQIVAKRHPQLGLSERGVLRTMTWHQEIFENVGEGVFTYRHRQINK
jgi:hypothetical protein